MTVPQLPLSKLAGRRGHARIAILTVIREEMDAARVAFGAHTRIQSTAYYYNREESAGNYQVVIGKCEHRTNSQAMKAVRDLIEAFRPPVIMLVGIAGGLENRDGIAVGDVVVADYVDYMEFVKIDHSGVHLRHLPLDQPAADLRTQIAEPVADDGRWVKSITVERPSDGTPKALIGMIVAGEKILSDHRNRVQKELLQPFEKAIAVDMESKGVAEAICSARTSVWYNPRYLVIRGISDMVEEVQGTMAVDPSRNPAGQDPVADTVDARAQTVEAVGQVGATVQSNSQQRDDWKQYAAAAAAAFAAAIATELVDRVYAH